VSVPAASERPANERPLLTPSQTVGPFFGIGLTWSDGPFVVPAGESAAIRIHGAVIDGGASPVPDALVETWQADADGRFAHPDDPRGAVTWSRFRGFGRCGSDEQGHWSIHTIKPGRVPSADGGMQAPHIDLSVFARGLLQRLVTRIYFADEPAANAADPVLARLASRPSAATLLAAADGDGYRFDIRLQGEGETLFFAL
jgi:protocatechuate 3,4-dioxygenase, alpha subunit